jgi:antirestriction protein ArdC
VLKEDKRAIFNAASYASQAADWVRIHATPEPQPDIERSQREMEESITY